MSIFSDVDFTDFWYHADYSQKQYEENLLQSDNDEIIGQVEKDLGYKLPLSYINLCRYHQNGGLLKKCQISTEDEPFLVNGLFSIGNSKPSSLSGPMGSKFWIEDWQYPDIGIYFADTPSAGHDMFCLDYSKCGPQGEPAVVHVDQEGDYEVTLVAKDFETFVRSLSLEEES
eukprot:gene48-51_t